jgi:cell wall-associated NlpC family hydrolase
MCVGELNRPSRRSATHRIMAQPQPKPSPLVRRIRSRAIAAFLASVPVVVAAQSSSPVTPPDAEASAKDPRPFAALSNTAMSMRDSVVFLARAQIGTRYRFGGTTPKGGFDCSGFVRYVLGALQFALPRTAAQQASVGDKLPKDTTRLRPGDLLTFGRGNRVTHIGIYVGDGRYVHASPTAGRVIETSLARTTSPLVKIWRGGRRLLADATGTLDSVAVTPTLEAPAVIPPTVIMP